MPEKQAVEYFLVLGLLVSTALAASSAAQAQGSIATPNAVCKDPRGCGPASSPSPAPSGPSQDEIKQQRERQRLKAKAWSTDEALDYFDRKDWDNAIRSFEEALDRDPDDPDLNAWLQRAKAEKAKARAQAVAAPLRPAPANDSKTVDARGATLAGGDLLAKVPELKNSPEADRIRKGWQALLDRDWPVALAWWQDALNRDPNNAALKRSVDLAQWMVDRQKGVRFGPVRSLGAASAAAASGNFDRALEILQQLKASNPAVKSRVDGMIEEIQKRRATLQLPDPKDVELIFQTPYTAAIAAVTQSQYSSAIDLLAQAKRENPSIAAKVDRMIANVRLISPLQLPDPDDVGLLIPERTYAGPLSGSGLEFLADGYNAKAKEIFDRINRALAPGKR